MDPEKKRRLESASHLRDTPLVSGKKLEICFADQNVQIDTSIQREELQITQLDASPCKPLQKIVIKRVPMESGKKAYIWPDDQFTSKHVIGGTGKKLSLSEFTKDIMEDGDTLYLKSGIFNGPIVTGSPKSYAGSYPLIKNGIHIRGAGFDKTFLKGYIWAGKDSSIKNVTVDNTGPHKDKTTVDIDSPGATLEMVGINGGRNGISVGGNMSSPNNAPVKIKCVDVVNSTFNGIMLGEMYRSYVHDSRIENVTVVGTGSMGIEILGNRVTIENVLLNNIGTNGMFIGGSYPYGVLSHDSQIKNVTIVGTSNVGLSVYGDRTTIDNLTLSKIGTWGLSIDGSDAKIQNSSFKNVASVGMGINGKSTKIKNVKLENIGSNGIFLGNPSPSLSPSPSCHNSRIENVTITGTGNVGVSIYGDQAYIDKLTLSKVGTGGLIVYGNDAKIQNSSFKNVAFCGIQLNGTSPEIKNVTLQNIGTTTLGTGVIFNKKSNNYVVNNSSFTSMRIGILIEESTGKRSNNVFKNIYYQDVLESKPQSPYPLIKVVKKLELKKMLNEKKKKE
jgi:hypothetical protein